MSRIKKAALLVVGLMVGLFTGGARAARAETLTATFTQPDGGITVNSYKGLVQIHVTGVGQSYGGEYNDAFYLLPPRFDPPQNGWDGSYYQLGFGTGPLAAFDQHNAENVLVGPLPAYNPAHDYTFVLNTGLSTPGPLHFGVTDRGFSDNTGAFTITVTQLDGNGSSVPDPPAPPSADPSSPPVYNPANGHWYQAVPVPGGITWPDARSAAQSQSYAGYQGHLATITSATETQFLVSHLPLDQDGHWRVGGFQNHTAPDYSEPAGGWRWITGEPGSYTNWRGGEPNNVNGGEDFLEIHQDGTWNDTNDRDLGGGYIVEYESPTSPSAASVAQLLVSPNPVIGGQSTTGQVVLSQLAGPGGMVVPLVSSNPAAAVVPATVTVLAGTTGITFPITTFAVGVTTPVVLTAGDPGSPVSATLQVQPGSTPAVNLLVNGSFEESVGDRFSVGSGVPGWRILKGTIDILTSSYWQSAPDGGSQSIDLLGSPGIATIEQSFPTVPGQDYLFTGYVSHNPSVAYGRANVFLNGLLFTQLAHEIPNSNANMQWQPFTYRFRATAPATTLTLSDVTGINDTQGTVLDGLAVTPVQTNLLVNGSFEEPKGAPYGTRNLPGWTVLGGTVDLVSAWQPAPGQGVQSLDLVGSPGAATIEQSFPTEPGRDYLFSGWVAHNSGIPEGRAPVFLNGTFFVQLYHNIPSTDAEMHWIAFSYPFRATAAVTTLSIRDVTGLSDLRGTALDGLAVTPMGGSPPPPPLPALAAPTNLAAKAVSATQIDLTWTDNSSDETGFEIQRRSGSGDWARIGLVAANVTRFSDFGVSPNMTYAYQVRALNDPPATRVPGASAWSDEASADTGVGAPPVSPSLSLNPGSLSFGDQLVGTANGAQSVLVQNIGQTPVEIRQVSIEGTNPGDFAITADGATGLQLLPGRLCIVNVRFLPTAAGPRSASLTITDTAGGSPHVAPLSGTGIAPAVRLSSGTLAYAEQPVGTTSGAQTVTITNMGTAPLSIPSVSLAGDNPGEFAIGTAVSGVTLAPGESRMLDVRFAPTRPGSRSAILVISDSAPGSPHLVALSGTGTAPSVTFGISRLERPTKVSFGDQPVGSSSAAQTLTVTNSGAAPLTISSVKITGANAADFALSADSGGPVLAPGASRRFTLRFRPASKGSRTASLTLSDNAAGSPHSVSLQGMGLLLPPKAPAGLTVKVASYKEIQLTWTAGSADATAYAIWRKVGNGEFQRCGGVAGNLTRFVDQHVTPKTSYTYRVRANGPGGTSGWSNEAAGTTPLAPPPVAPTGLTVRALSASQMELRWTDTSSDETSFALWRKSGSGTWARVGGVPTGVSRYVDRKLVPNTSYSYQVRANGPGGVSAWSNVATGKTPGK